MPIFELKNKKTIPVKKSKKFKEKEIQNIFEKNLKSLLDIKFLATEYVTSFGGRIDTLGIDTSGSPVIIEYKKGSNENIINQGLSYLRWLLDHKAEFEKLINKKTEIDWSQPRVICIAQSFNKYDLDAVGILPIKIELITFKLYSNNILLIESEKTQKVKISTSKIFKKIKKQYRVALQKDYNLEYHIGNKNKSTKELFYALREEILKLDNNIKEKIRKLYVSYEITKNFVEFHPQAKNLKIFIDIPFNKLKDPKKITDDVSEKGHWGTGSTRFKIYKIDDIEYAIFLIKQSYEYNL